MKQKRRSRISRGLLQWCVVCVPAKEMAPLHPVISISVCSVVYINGASMTAATLDATYRSYREPVNSELISPCLQL
jgi:hypothetical protein